MNRPLWNTQNDLAELNQELADALDLALQAKQAHWNVKGPSCKVEPHGQAKD